MGKTIEDIEKIAAYLEALPPVESKKRQVTKSDAVVLLQTQIRGLQERGYTLEKIAELIKTQGLDIATPTLKSYLQRVKRAQKPTARGRAKVSRKGAQQSTPKSQAGDVPEHEIKTDSNQTVNNTVVTSGLLKTDRKDI